MRPEYFLCDLAIVVDNMTEYAYRMRQSNGHFLYSAGPSVIWNSVLKLRQLPDRH